MSTTPSFLFLKFLICWLEQWLDDYLILACYAFFRDVTLLSFVIYVVDLVEVRLAHVSYIRNSLEHSEKISQPPFLTCTLDKDKKLVLAINKNQNPHKR